MCVRRRRLAPAFMAASPARLPVRWTSLMPSSLPSSNAASHRNKSEPLAASSSPWQESVSPEYVRILVTGTPSLPGSVAVTRKA
ncbi:hypothetical protein D3C73_1539000 [compost metagenome]